MSGRWRRGAGGILVVSVVLAVTGTACGSRLGRDRLARSLAPAQDLRPASSAPLTPSGSSGAAAVPGASVTPSPVSVAAGSAATPAPQSSSSGGAVPAPASARGTAGPAAPAAGGGGAGNAPTSAAGRGPAGAAGPARPSPAPGDGAGPGPAVPATGGEIRLGSFGVQSGILGATMAPFFQGARAWAADVAARGGLNGHPVRLIFGDDGGDPAKAQALVHRMVEQDKVQAFYTVAAPTTLQAATPYLEQVQVPIIGLCECNPAVDESPMAFQPGIGSTTGLAWAHLAPLVGMSDKRQLSIFYCREVPSCSQSAEGIKRLAGQVGVHVVNETQMSLAQPDYTAEVLSARNAGADALIVVADGATIVRILRSAHRQNYKPQVSTPTAGYEPDFIRAGGDDVEGTVVASSTVPWSTSPRLADYRTAMARYVPDGEMSTLGAEMWGAGKLIELLAKRFPANPTAADFLDGLYALRGETVGGIFPPLAFVKGKGHAATNQCVIPVKVAGGQFKPLSDDRFSCAPGWTPVTP